MAELRKGFHHELDEVKQEVLRLAASTIESIARATNVILSGDLEGADYLIQFDDEIDARSVDLEDRCYQILALQAPVAGDLRQVVALVKMVAEIERSSDLTVNICKAARRIYGHETGDVAKAAALDDMDSYLDGLQRQFVQAILESHSAGHIELQVAIQLAVVARFYERIGDHAVNMAERVLYMITGWLPEHKGAARFKERTGEIPRPPEVD
jgi:phosphate transport system protein